MWHHKCGKEQVSCLIIGCEKLNAVSSVWQWIAQDAEHAVIALTTSADDVPSKFQKSARRVSNESRLLELLLEVEGSAFANSLPHSRFGMVAGGGIEPPTQGFSVLCSTD